MVTSYYYNIKYYILKITISPKNAIILQYFKYIFILYSQDEKELVSIQLTKITKNRSCYDCELCGFETKSTDEKFGQPLERHDHLVGKDHFKEKLANISKR